jgi:hypothetical protein
MKTDHEIPLPVRIPNDYVHEFKFLGKHGVFVIQRGRNGGLGITQKGRLTPKESSRCMDWMGEVVARIRAEVGW